MGSREILHRRELLQGSKSHKALSRGYGLRILPRRPESDSSTERPVQSTMVQSQLNRRQPISLDGQGFRLFRRYERVSLSADAFLPARNDGTMVVPARLHKNSAQNEARYLLGARLGETHSWGKETL